MMQEVVVDEMETNNEGLRIYYNSCKCRTRVGDQVTTLLKITSFGTGDCATFAQDN